MIDQILIRMQAALPFIAGLSAVTFLLSLLCIPLIVARLPENYFQQPDKNTPYLLNGSLSFSSILFFLGRNTIGLFLFLAGIVMLFLPGQGLITMILGLGIMSFPYKHQLIYRATRPVSIQNGMDWLRGKTGKTNFTW